MKDDTLFWALCDIDEALILRAKETPSPGKKNRKPLRIMLVAAAVLVALGAGTALAANTQLGRAVLSWTSETFWLRYGNDEEPAPYDAEHYKAENVPIENDGERTMLPASVTDGSVSLAEFAPELIEFERTLIDRGITEPLIPKYLPEGYVPSEFYSEERAITAAYEKEDHTVFIMVREIDTNNGARYEHDGGQPEIYTVGGITHAISTNLGNYTAVWENQGYECSIMGVPSRNELIRMIDSIYALE